MRQFLLLLLATASLTACNSSHNKKKEDKTTHVPDYQWEEPGVLQTDSMTTLVIADLRRSGVDTLVAYTLGEDNFIFWQKNGARFIQQIHRDADGWPLRADSSALINTIVTNWGKIRTDSLLCPSSSRKGRGTLLMTSHPSISSFRIYIGDRYMEKEVNHFNLETRMIKEKVPNVNYSVNQKTCLKLISDIAKKETDRFEKQPSFSHTHNLIISN